jgi:urease accessory protein UreF
MTTAEEYDQATAEAWIANVKAMFDQHLRDAERERNQKNDWEAFALETARNHAQIVNRLAQDAATVSTRIAANAATWDNLVFAGALTNPAELAETAIGAKVAEQVRSAAKDAIDAAVAAVPGTSAASQGTTGVAQGAMQSGVSVADAAILAQIAKLAEAVNVMYIKVLGEEVTAEKPK